MINAFQKFGFGVDFVKWVCIFMKDTKNCVNYCGRLSYFFAVEYGIRQGCPLAFVLAVELLAIKIKECKDIKGIKNWSSVNDVYMEAVVKIALYADDITLFLQNENEMSNALSIMEGFSRISGLEINKTKSESHVAW